MKEHAPVVAPPEAQDDGQPSLVRSLGLPLLTLYGLGNILGAGIYVLVGEVAGAAGMLAPLAFLVAAAVAATSALSYGELAARFPVSAGEAVYVDTAFGWRWLSTAIGLAVASIGIISAATLARGVVGYVQVLVEVPPWIVLTTVVALLGGLAIRGIEQSARVAAAFTLVEAGGLLLVVLVASDSLAEAPAHVDQLLVPTGDGAWIGVLGGAFLAFFAFTGFEDMVNVAEEVRRPERTLPRAIVLALLLSTLLYLFVVTTSLLATSAETLASSDAPLATVYTAATGREPRILGAIGVVAILNGLLIQLIMASRILYGMSRRGWLPKALGRVDERRRTPVTATAVAAVVVLGLSWWLPVGELASATSFVVLGVFCTVNLALVRIRRADGDAPRGRRVSVVVPVLGALTSLGLLLAQALG